MHRLVAAVGAAAALVAALALAVPIECRDLPPPPGEPTADPKAVVQLGSNMRITVLTERLLRLEAQPAGAPAAFEDRQTLAVLNRRLPVPPYTVATQQGRMTIDTGALQLSVVANGSSGGPVAFDTLRIALKESGTVWTPDSVDSLNLFGTFHTLDTLGGWQDMNCSHHRGFHMEGTGPFLHCEMGLVSRSNWTVLDDSRRPLFEPADGWAHPQLGGVCDANRSRDPCFPQASNNPSDPVSCRKAGCCWQVEPVALYLFYSASRHDHYSDPTCLGCPPGVYTQIRQQGFLNFADNASVQLNLYWNPANGGDNVLSTSLPALPGYSFVRPVGLIAAAPGPNLHVVKLWYNAALTDHFTTACAADEAEAAAGGYTLVSTLGYILEPSNSSTLPGPPTDAPPACFQRLAVGLVATPPREPS